MILVYLVFTSYYNETILTGWYFFIKKITPQKVKVSAILPHCSGDMKPLLLEAGVTVAVVAGVAKILAANDNVVEATSHVASAVF